VERPDQSLLHALLYAGRGWPVLPLFSVDEDGCECRRSGCGQPGKHPRTMHGYKDATLEADQIRTWWRMWPTSNVGIGTGDGLVVYDVDPRNGGESTFEAAIGGRSFPRVPTVCTGGGGLHFYFTGQGRSGHLGEGVDIQADGKLVVAPPSLHASGIRYTWCVFGAETVPVPVYLYPPVHERTETGRAPVRASRTYIRAAFDAELEAVRTAAPGTRNDTLNVGVLKISRFIGEGKLPTSLVVESFRDAALQAGLAGPEVDATIRSALTAGGVLA
jgi:Bifunctional DNA primase/polymerase, N-terminal